ncbi:MAG: chemotaxis-specific protein-glutamate methyltransferase CheB [Sphingomicrobium sp.]
MERALARSRDRQPEPPTGRRMRLMIVDDSMVARAVLSRMIESDPEFEIAAVAGTAEEAIDMLDQCRVDAVILDLEMPGDGGLKSIPRIIAAAGGAKVMVVSSQAEDGAEQTVAALALGAADTLPKPGTGRFNGRFSEILLAKLRALGHAPMPLSPLAADRNRAHDSRLRAMPADPISALAIGASTGGIHALNCLFAKLPVEIGVPILITQHLPAPFMPVFARQLATVARRETMVAEDGLRLKPDRIIIAPGDAHLAIEPDGRHVMVRLSNAPASSGCRPSVEPMLASVGSVYGNSALGVMLTGMGRDGVEGAARMVACGGTMIAQDEASSAVWGMPRAVFDAGLASALLSPDKIARRIAARTEEPAPCK